MRSALETMAFRMRWLLAQHDDLDEMVAEHEQLLIAITERDADRAARPAEDHLVTSRRAALQRRDLAD